MKKLVPSLAALLTALILGAPVLADEEGPWCGTTGFDILFWKRHTPQIIEKTLELRGLRQGEFIGAVDFDQSAGVLYGAGNHGGFYRIDTDTGQVSFMGSVGFDIDFPCGNDLRWFKKCPGCPPPPPPNWDFVIQQDLIAEVTLTAAGGVGVSFRPIPQFPAGSPHFGSVPHITGLAALPSAARGPQWDLYYYDLTTCGLYQEVQNFLYDLLHPGCWPPDVVFDNGVLGLDVVAGPQPVPWFPMTVPMATPTGVSTMFGIADPAVAGGQLQQLGLVGGGGVRVLDSTALITLGGCPADLNGDGLIDFSDYLVFLNYFDAQDPRADFNGDGLIDFSDYLDFLNHFDAGC